MLFGSPEHLKILRYNVLSPQQRYVSLDTELLTTWYMQLLLLGYVISIAQNYIRGKLHVTGWSELALIPNKQNSTQTEQNWSGSISVQQ